MNKKQIIDKIVNDLPTSDMRGEMTKEEWYGWFEECWDKAINYTHCCELLICYNDNIIDKSLTLKKEYEKIHEHNGMVVIVNDFDEVMSYSKQAFFKAN